MIFLLLYLIFAALSGYIWFQIYKEWSEEYGAEDFLGRNTRWRKGEVIEKPEYRYKVKPLYIIGFVILTFLSLIGVIIGVLYAAEEDIDILNIKIK